MNNWAPETTVLIHSLGWALCHSLWQCLLVFIILKTVLKFVPSSQSTIRYNVALAGLLAMTVWFVDTWIQYWQKLKGIAVLVTEAAANNQLPTRSHVITTPLPKANFQYDIVSAFIYGLERWFPVLVSIYVCGLLLLLFRFCLNLCRVNGLRTHGTTEASEDIYAKLFHWQEQLGISKKVRLFYSAKINAPMMLGTIKPVILFPLATASHLSIEQLEAILLHELAHIKRYDYLVNMLQTVIETILFFNPFIWLTSSIIRTEREHCCDDMVLAHTYPLAYAKALATLETSRISSGSLSMGATGTSKNHLLTRIKRIMELKPNQTTDSRIVAITLIIGVMLVSLICFSPSFAQDKKDKKKEPEKKLTKVWVKEEKITIEDKNGKKKTYTSLEEMPQEDRKRYLEGEKKNNTTTYFGSEGKKLVDKKDSVAVENSRHEVAEFSAGMDIDGIVEDAMNSIDWKQIGAEVDKAIKDVDWKQVDEDIKSSLKEAENALKEIDWKEIEKQIESATKKLDSLDRKKVKAELEKAKLETRRAMAESRQAMAESRRALAESRRAMAESRRAVEQSRAEQIRAEAALRRIEAEGKRQRQDDSSDAIHAIMISKMIGDGVVDTSRDYRILMSKGELQINRKLQPADVHKRYLPYLKETFYYYEKNRNDK